jgi:hypothetical protein
MIRRSEKRSCVVAICCALSLVAVPGSTAAQDGGQASAETVEETAALLPPDQLDSLVAPIALYPDNLLAQVLVSSTYPLEIMQLQQWLGRNPDLEGDALADAVAEQPWDPSIQSMAVVPEAVERLANDIQWTTELGNAFLAQQGDVMDAVQRMRKGAQDKGALESNEQQVVETKVVEKTTVIVVEAANPEVIYVPSYNPTYVYPPPIYPYPPVYYPPYYAGGAFISFGVGFVWGAAVGGACCGCGWGRNDVNIDINNNFNRNTDIDRGDRNTNIDRGDRGGERGGERGGGTWKHDPQHRGGAPYSDRATADKFGGTARGDSLSNRQASARQQQAGRQGGTRGSSPSAGSMNRSAGGAGNLSGSLSGGSLDRSSAGAGSRSGSPSASSRSGSGRSPSASSDRIGNRSIPSSGSSRSGGGFGGSSSGFSGSSARSYSSRGASSMGSRGGGGRSRGGGGRRR